MKLKDSKEILSSVLKTTQMGQIGIRSALEAEMKPELRQAMEAQLQEYDAIETQAHSIATERNWVLPELNPSIRFMTDRMTKMRLSRGDVNSKIAAMMIRGNTSGVIKGFKNLRHIVKNLGMIHVGSLKVFYLVRHVREQIVQRRPQLAVSGFGVYTQSVCQTFEVCGLFNNSHFENLLC